MNIKNHLSYKLRSIGFFIDTIGESYLKSTKSEVSFSQFLLLAGVHELNNPSITRLARWINITPPSATYLVKKLSEKGLVNVAFAKGSLREKTVILTPQGDKLTKKLFEEINQCFKKHMSIINKKQLSEFSEIIDTLYKNFNESKHDQN